MRLCARVDPAGVDTAIQRVGHLRIDRRTESGQATERRLDMPAGATEPVIKIEMAKRGIEVIKPHQADDTAAEPDALRITGGTIDGLRGFCELVGLALAVFSGIRSRRRLRRLVLGPRISALGEGASNPDEKGKAGRSDALNKCRTISVKNATHEVPNRLRAAWRPVRCKLSLEASLGKPLGKPGNPQSDPA